jgi:hypothetical protein
MSFAEYLVEKRARAAVAASPALENAEVLLLMLKEHANIHGSALHYQYIGDDSAGAAVWKLGTQFLLQDISVQLAALIDAGSISQVAGTNDPSYSVNPHLRK